MMPSTLIRRYIAIVYGIPMIASGGCATDQPPIGPLPPAPALTANAVRGSALTDARLTYQTTTILDSTLSHSVQTRRISIARSSDGAAAFWLVVSGRDTMQLDVNSLRPRRVYSRLPANEKACPIPRISLPVAFDFSRVTGQGA